MFFSTFPTKHNSLVILLYGGLVRDMYSNTDVLGPCTVLYAKSSIQVQYCTCTGTYLYPVPPAVSRRRSPAGRGACTSNTNTTLCIVLYYCCTHTHTHTGSHTHTYYFFTSLYFCLTPNVLYIVQIFNLKSRIRLLQNTHRTTKITLWRHIHTPPCCCTLYYNTYYNPFPRYLF